MDLKNIFAKINSRITQISTNLLVRMLSLPKKYLSFQIVHRVAPLLSKINPPILDQRTKPHFLILRNKYYAKGSPQPSTEFHHLDQTLKDSELATFEVLTYDEDLWISPIADLQLIYKCITKKSDAIILSSWWTTSPYHPSLFSIEYIRKQLKIPIVSIWWDTCSKKSAGEISKILNIFDVNVVLDNPHLYFFDKTRAEFQSILSLWAPQDAHLFTSGSNSRTIEVSFVGQVSSYRSYRNDVINYLKEQKTIPFYFSGSERKNQMSHEAYAEIFKTSKMSINFSMSVDCDQLKSRVFEVLLSGALLLESENEQTSFHFKPFIDYVPYRSKEDLVEKIQYYSNHPDELAQISTHGQKTAQQRFNSTLFWQSIVNRIKDLPKS